MFCMLAKELARCPVRGSRRVIGNPLLGQHQKVIYGRVHGLGRTSFMHNNVAPIVCTLALCGGRVATAWTSIASPSSCWVPPHLAATPGTQNAELPPITLTINVESEKFNLMQLRNTGMTIGAVQGPITRQSQQHWCDA